MKQFLTYIFCLWVCPSWCPKLGLHRPLPPGSAPWRGAWTERASSSVRRRRDRDRAGQPGGEGKGWNSGLRRSVDPRFVEYIKANTNSCLSSVFFVTIRHVLALTDEKRYKASSDPSLHLHDMHIHHSTVMCVFAIVRNLSCWWMTFRTWTCRTKEPFRWHAVNKRSIL